MEFPSTNGCVKKNPTMTPQRTKPHVDHRAVAVAQSAISKSDAELAILFGSRARGDYREATSDIDVMLVQEQETDANRKREVADAVATAAAQAYGYPVSVDLVWRTVNEFRLNRHYINSVETNAVRDGIVMPRDPENYSPHDYEDEENEYAYDWTNYDERLRHAETHLNEFIFLAENGRSDLVIGQQAQNALEHGMKALISAAGGQYSNTHDIGTLLGNVRHFDRQMRDFTLAITPDVYTEYEGQAEYRQRQQPELTQFPDFVEQTQADVNTIIDRAKALRDQAD